jgi:hypothetical protein
MPARWTIILGENGVGKTTLLQCLARCQAVRPNERLFDSHDWWQLAAGQSAFLSASLRNDARDETGEDYFDDVDWPVTAELEADFGLGLTLESAQTAIYSPEQLATLSSSRSQFGGVHTVMTTAKDLGGSVCYGYGATRRMGAVALSEQQENDTTASLFSDDVTLLNAEEWLLQADYSALIDSPLQEQARLRRDQLIDVLVNLLPDVADVRFVRPKEIGRKPGVEVQVPYGWVSISDLSLGYRALVAWIVDFAYRMFERYPKSETPLAEPAIVLVDEIDLHLHPKWQRSLISYLTERFPNTQFIVTAHSPLIVQAATDANIVLLRREGDHVVIENDLEAIRGWRIDQVLTSDLFGLETARPPEYDELLAERTKLLGKAKLTKKDEARLKKIEAEIGDLPAGESVADIEAMDVIRRAAEVLKREGKNGR